MIKTHRVGVVGMGHVGAHVANSLLLQGICGELYLCDVKAQKLTSECQDLSDSLSFAPVNTKVVNVGDAYEQLACCDVIVNAAGNVGLAAESRDGELAFTTDACRTFAGRIAQAGFEGVWVSIANPCDVVATELQLLTGCDPARVIGSGTELDSSRFRTVLARQTGWDPRSISAYMIGEHGDSMFACWSHVAFGGKPLSDLAREQPERFAFDRDALEHTARRAGYVTMAGKGCTEYAVANCAARICRAVLNDEHAIMAAGTYLTGQYGERGIYTSLPCVIGARGVEEVIELDFDERELACFHATCDKVRANIAKIPWWPGVDGAALVE